ncbi:MAG: response regulator [Nitrospinota bacterium]
MSYRKLSSAQDELELSILKSANKADVLDSTLDNWQKILTLFATANNIPIIAILKQEENSARIVAINDQASKQIQNKLQFQEAIQAKLWHTIIKKEELIIDSAPDLAMISEQIKKIDKLNLLISLPLILGSGETFGSILLLDFAKNNQPRKIKEKLYPILGIVLTDIENTKRFQEKINLNLTIDSLLHRSIEQANQPILIADPNGSVLYVNQTFEKLIKQSRKDLAGYRSNMLGGVEQSEKFLANVWKIIRSGKIWSGSIKNRCKDGSVVTSELLILPVVDQNEQVINFIGIFKGISSSDSLDQDLEQSKKMEAVGILASGVAHDFNNILSAIIGHGEMALESAVALASKDSSLLTDINEILAASEHAKELARQILDFGNNAKEKLQPISLAKVVNKALELLSAGLSNNIKIVRNIESSLAMILADKTKVAQIIINLISNAEFAMRGKSGKLEVSLTETIIDKEAALKQRLPKEGNYLKLVIADNGSGIDHDVLDKIFEPFFTTKGDSSNSGLGLSIVYKIINSYQGAINVDSIKGEGTSFTLYFPVIKEKIHSSIETSKVTSLGTESILYIDDEPSITKIATRILTRLGYLVTPFNDPYEALAAFKSDPDLFDIIITDQTMPRLTGLDLAKQIRKLNRDIPIILATGYSSLANEQIAKKAGIDKFVLKPMTKGELSDAIRVALDGRKDQK